ncbi:MAG: hypothetical protein ACPGVU_10410 [Limisphaerales bacterium]
MDELFGSPFEEDLSGWALPAGNRPHRETVELVRGIAGSGTLTEQEVYLLAGYLNDNRDARHAWPGDRLFRHLSKIFGSGSVSESESEYGYLGRVLEELDRQGHAIAAPPEEEPELPETAVKVEDLILPQLDLSLQVAAEGARHGFEVDLARHSCSCPGWYGNRRQFKGGDLKLCCAHLAAGFVEAFHQGLGAESPRVLKSLLWERAQRGRGINPKSTWKLIKIRLWPHLVSYDRGAWSSVYAFNAMKELQRYAFIPEEERWSFGQAPKNHRVLAEFIRKHRERSTLSV